MTKVCTKCKQEKDISCFHKRSVNKDGLATQCKDCYNEYNKKRIANFPKQPIISKKCTKCGHVKQANEFAKGRNNKDGLHPWCKVCDKKDHAEWFQKHFDEEKVRQHKWQTNNPEKFKQTTSNWRKSQKGKLSQSISRKKKRLIKKQVESTFTEEQWQECLEHFNYSCAYCGSTNKLQQDHFIPIIKYGPYTKENMVVACGFCNPSKGDSDFYDWYPKQKFYSKERENKILEYLGYDKLDKAN